MARLVDECKARLPRAFETEEFERRKSAIFEDLHRANGGYLVLDARDVFRNFLAWEVLKNALKSRSARIEEPLEEYRLVATAGLAPEPITLSVKLVLLGTPLLYHLLHTLDEDFRELFNGAVELALAAHVRRYRELRDAPASPAAPAGGSP
jgi:hypothetical protein